MDEYQYAPLSFERFVVKYTNLRDLINETKAKYPENSEVYQVLTKILEIDHG